MSSKLARFLSYIFHPLLMPFYAVILVMNLNTYIAYSISPQVQRIIISLVFITTGAMPVITALLLLQKGAIRSMEMESIEERRIPFITTAVYYLSCYYLLQQLPIPRILGLMVLGATVTIFIAWLLSFRWKVSIHMIGIGGFTGLLFAISQILGAPLLPAIILIILISGVLGSSRLILNAHTPAQVYSGFLIGLFTEWWLITWLSR
jgi:hypothetical protein